MADNVLASIPGEHIARAAMSLPEARDAPDEPQYVELHLDGRRLLLTFKRFKHKRGKTTRWFWTAERAEIIKTKGIEALTKRESQ